MKKVFLFAIKIYQKYISPLKRGKCRFYPTCSQYSFEAIDKYGAWHGLGLAVRRIVKCHPFNPGGYDPVK